MFFLQVSFVLSVSECTLLYNDSCPICVTHFADRQCGYCRATKKCISIKEDCPAADFYYGPSAKCTDEHPAPYNPTPSPLPAPTPLPENCDIYTKDGCEVCTNHYSDRKCGWCSKTNKCESSGSTTCPKTDFYYGGNAKCNAPIPLPTRTPYPRYEADPTFCQKYTGTDCPKCVSTNPNMSCIWCYSSKECVMGDSVGPFYGQCPDNDFALELRGRCFASASTWTLNIWITVAFLVTIAIVLGVYGCCTASSLKEKAAQYDAVK